MRARNEPRASGAAAGRRTQVGSRDGGSTDEGQRVRIAEGQADNPRRKAWETDVRIRTRPGRPDSGVKLYVTDRGGDGPREYMANTGFMRYPLLFATLARLIGGFPPERAVRVLIAPLSVGLEAVSLAIACERAGLFDGRVIAIEGFDISRKATELALGGTYPRLFFPDDLAPFGTALDRVADGHVEIAASILRHVRVLPAGDVLQFRPERPYEMVVCLNLLMHLADADRPALVDKLAALTAPDGILCLNNNQEWPGELAPWFAKLTAPGGGFRSLHAELGSAPNTGVTPAGPVPEFARTDANAMILRGAAA